PRSRRSSSNGRRAMSDRPNRIDEEFTAADYDELAATAHAVEAIDLDALSFDSTAAVEELPPASESDPMVVSTLRVTLDLELRVKAIASSRGVPVTALMREFLIDGVEAAENAAGAERDPVSELHRIADAASRALRALESHRPAAA